MLPMYCDSLQVTGREGRKGREGGRHCIYMWLSLPNIVSTCAVAVYILTSIPIHIASSGSVTDCVFLFVMKERSSASSAL